MKLSIIILNSTHLAPSISVSFTFPSLSVSCPLPFLSPPSPVLELPFQVWFEGDQLSSAVSSRTTISVFRAYPLQTFCSTWLGGISFPFPAWLLAFRSHPCGQESPRASPGEPLEPRQPGAWWDWPASGGAGGSRAVRGDMLPADSS